MTPIYLGVKGENKSRCVMGMTGWPVIIELDFEPLTQNAVFTEHNRE